MSRHLEQETHDDPLRVGPLTTARLPKGVDYEKKAFSRDIMSLVEPQRRRRLRNVVNDWTTKAAKSGYMSEHEAKVAAVRYARGLLDLKRSEEVAFIKELCDTIPEAAQTILDHLEAQSRRNSQPLFDPPEDPKPGKQRTGTNWTAPYQGQKAGKESATLMSRVLKLGNLIPACRERYQFVSERPTRCVPSIHPESELDIRGMRSYQELRRLPRTAWLQDDDILDLKIMHRRLVVSEYLRRVPAPMTFVLLLDVSGSMEAELTDGFMRFEWATAVALTVLELAQEAGNKCILIRFDYGAFPPVVGLPEEVAMDLWKGKFSGGGTNFAGAFEAAVAHKPDRIIMITDGEDSVSEVPPLLDVLVTGPGNDYFKKRAARYIEVA